MTESRVEDAYHQFLARCTHHAVRDLAWCLGSPPLLDSHDPQFAGHAVTLNWCREHFQRFLPQLRDLALDPTPLVRWCSARPNQKLGRYFETLISYWLHHVPGITDIRESVQVRQNSQTLGEFDFLFYDETAPRPYHLEVAVKFYLRHRTGLHLEDYLGPSGTDRLDRKIHLLLQKQLVLGAADAGRAFLQDIHGGEDVTSLALVKGMIFDPLSSAPQAAPVLARGLSPDCLRGSWVTLSGLKAEPLDGRWCIIPRLHWLSPVILQNTKETMSGKGILGLLEAHFAQYPDPVMLCALNYHQERAVWMETQRLFVLKDASESGA